ncbi:hypothetical protein PGB90_000369 [Kerria lacca]
MITSNSLLTRVVPLHNPDDPYSTEPQALTHVPRTEIPLLTADQLKTILATSSMQLIIIYVN